MGERMIIRHALPIEHVNWAAVLDLMVRRFKIPFVAADKQLNDFLKRFCRPLNLAWFLDSALSEDDNLLMQLVGECHGADIVTLVFERRIRLGPGCIAYRHAYEFEPRFGRAQATGTVRPRVELRILGRQVTLASARAVALCQLLVSLLGVVFYVVVVGLLLYGLSVLMLFLREPMDVTRAATSRASIGTALLCVLVAVAALTGRAVRNIAGEIRRRLVKGRSDAA